jgi:hypothetical protein
MTPTNLLRRLFLHVAMASSLLVLSLLMLERLVPGFVSPFVDLPDVGLVVVFLVAVSLAIQPPEERRLPRVISTMVFALIAVLGVMYLWSRVGSFGLSGVALIAAVGVSVCLFVVALWSGDE